MVAPAGWRGVGGAVLVLGLLAGGPGQALDGDVARVVMLGSCEVALTSDGANGMAEVHLSVPGVGMFFPEGAVFSGGGVAVVGPSIDAAVLEACGLSDVADLEVDGPQEPFDADDRVGLRFRARQDGVVRQFDLALAGGTGTQAVVSILPAGGSQGSNLAPDLTLAGPAEAASGATVTVASGAHDPEGAALDILWTQVDATGQAVGFSDARATAPQVVLPTLAPGSAAVAVLLRVEVSDGVNRVTGTLTIRVLPPEGAPNAPPVARAVLEGAAVAGGRVTLSAAGSSDPDGDGLSYRWVQRAGPVVVLDGADAARAGFEAPPRVWSDAAVTFVFEVTVSDGRDSRSTTVTFALPPPQRGALLARIAGAGGEVVAGARIVLDGRGSQGDGTSVLSYHWSVDAAGLAAGVWIESPGAAETVLVLPQVAAPVPVTVRLTVEEAAGTPQARQATAELALRLLPNAAPVPSAVVPAQVVAGAQVRLDGSGSADAEGEVLDLDWRQIDGPSVVLEPCAGASGAVVCFAAPQIAPGSGAVALLFRLEATDGVNTVARNFAVTVLPPVVGPPPGPPPAVLQAVDGLLRLRLTAVIAGQPDLGFVLADPGGGAAALQLSSSGGEGRLDSPAGHPVWLRLAGRWMREGGTTGGYGMAAAGAHLRLAEGLALGVMVQGDRIRIGAGAGLAEGTGWLAGPYLVARLPQAGLTLQARLLRGRTENRLLAEGAAGGRFAGDRLLAQLGLSGAVARGGVLWRPALVWTHAREGTEAFVDGTGTAVPSRHSRRAQISAGLEAVVPVAVAAGAMQARMGLAAVWVDGDGAEGGRLSFGLERDFASGARLTVGMDRDFGRDGGGPRSGLGVVLMLDHRF